MQKTALFRFKQSLIIRTPRWNGEYYSYEEDDVHDIPSPPKTKNWSMNSDYCMWDGVSCDEDTGDLTGLDLSCSHLVHWNEIIELLQSLMLSRMCTNEQA